jgi:hypothetical protein
MSDGRTGNAISTANVFLKETTVPLLIPGHLVRRWEIQTATPYVELPEEQKESDREQVRRYLPIIAAALSRPE